MAAFGRSPIGWDGLRSDPSLARLRDLAGQVARFAHEADLDLATRSLVNDPDWVTRVLNRVSATFTVMVVGQVSSGKSSLLNSLIGRQLLKTSGQPTDGVISVLIAAEPGVEEHAEWIAQDGSVVPFPSLAVARRFLDRQFTSQAERDACREVRLHLHAPLLRRLRLVNTPGIEYTGQSQVSLQYLHEDESDLVVWTFLPDTAGHRHEQGTFVRELARRRGAVVGVVTRCLQGHENDPGYDPREDESLQEVVSALQAQLGEYLREIVLYDSHEALRLVERMRQEPLLQDEPEFRRQLDRCGYAGLMRALRQVVGDPDDRAQEARARSLLRRCHATAVELLQVAAEAEGVFSSRAQVQREQVDAWDAVEREVVEPCRRRIRARLDSLVRERSPRLVTLTGDAACTAVDRQLRALSTLGRAVGSRLDVCDPPADALNKAVEAETERVLREKGFLEELEESVNELLTEQLAELKDELEHTTGRAIASRSRMATVEVEPLEPGAFAEPLVDDVLADAAQKAIEAMSRTLKVIMAQGAEEGIEGRLIASLAAQALRAAAVSLPTATGAAGAIVGGTALVAGEEAGLAAVGGGAAGAGAAGGAGTLGAASGAGAASAAGGAGAVGAGGAGAGAAAVLGPAIAVLAAAVLVGFVIKTGHDFREGREQVKAMIRAEQDANRGKYESQLLAQLVPMVDAVLSNLLWAARAVQEERDAERRRLIARAGEVASCRTELADLAEGFAERVDGR